MSEKNMQKKKTRKFVLFCRVMPVLGGILAVFVGIIILILVRGAGEDGKDGNGLISIWMPRVYVEPIVSAAEQFPDFNIQEEFLTINDYSRPGDEIDRIQKIVIHYTGNPGTTAQANRDYFESLAENPVTSASSHFVIGLNGEIIQCVPLNEIAYASNKANSYSISIECCHPDESGEFSTATYNQCVALTAELCRYYHLDPETDVIRHYDVTGKECPRFYVEHPDEWDMFLGFVKDRLES
ncbi:MAG: N-acetylmuramoyl-L-alanine amidase [Bacteroides sp.]|nr:N-acetylmuramoyl-L-alanine amidase [Bacteroides sp.]MCM1550813.1 N-acetylmuramoyl-L-alanine amidase [Clostridium sp.]